MKIVFTDTMTLGQDIDYSAFEAMGEVVRYSFSTEEETLVRSEDADIMVLNKTKINECSIANAKNLKLICVTATGTDNLDKDYLAKRGIQWRNVAGYSTESVAQHTFALLFYLLEKLHYYNEYTKSGRYVGDKDFTHFETTFHELYGKTWGIIGLGAIGRRVADIAKAFGARVIYYSPSGSAPQEGYEQVDFNTLLTQSDILTLHTPLTDKTKGIMNEAAFKSMKDSAILINVARGPVVDEEALAHALETGEIAAAGIDVLSVEPMTENNPLSRITDPTKLIITPHIAWAGIETRHRLMDIVAGQIKEFMGM